MGQHQASSMTSAAVPEDFQLREGLTVTVTIIVAEGHDVLMVPNAAIRNLIREDKVHQIYSQMQVGQSKFSMQTMNQSLATLYQTGKISIDDAFAKSNDLMELKQMLGQV